ncbi:MAG: CPBP family intramembrane glutamic endopeptidase, partial [Petrimonas sp.]|nr:CPBP family intramembrane glutamic endopeptidase [Petrimonas sp.]
EQIVLPDSLKVIEDWMRQMEDAAKQVTDLFLSGETIPDLFLNLLIIAAAAAFVEEVFFRGVLQQFIEKWLHNGHAAVWVGAFIFSAIHLQFYGFIPRLIMGAVLGYLFLYSRNLWIPILYHFVNNAAVVVITYFWDENNFLKQLEDKPLTWMSLVVMTASGLLTYFLFLRYKELFKKDDSN